VPPLPPILFRTLALALVLVLVLAPHLVPVPILVPVQVRVKIPVLALAPASAPAPAPVLALVLVRTLAFSLASAESYQANSLNYTYTATNPASQAQGIVTFVVGVPTLTLVPTQTPVLAAEPETTPEQRQPRSNRTLPNPNDRGRATQQPPLTPHVRPCQVTAAQCGKGPQRRP
jgi:hypothetical protein